MEKTLGKRIAAGRKKLKLTQDQLAEQLGVTAQAVSKWENNQSCPDISMLPKLAELFGTTTDALLGMEPVHEAQVVESENESFRIGSGNVEVHYNGGRKGALGFALWVLATGGLLLSSALLSWELGFWEILWTTGFIVFGLFSLYPKFSFLGLGCALFGGYFLAGNFFPLYFNKSILLPVLLMLFGLSLLADALRKPKHKGVKVVRNGRDGLDADVKKNTFVCKDDHFVTSNSFGDANRRVVLDCLAKGQASVSFGDLELDLTGVKEFAPDCRLDLSCSFGDMDVQVPKTCRVEHTASSSFADVSIEGHPNPDAKYRIFVNCSANFGDISIEYV